MTHTTESDLQIVSIYCSAHKNRVFELVSLTVWNCDRLFVVTDLLVYNVFDDTVVKGCCSNLSFWSVEFNKVVRGERWYISLDHFEKKPINGLIIVVTEAEVRVLIVINLAPLYCMDSNLSMSFCVFGSIIDLISARYAVLRLSLGKCCRVLLKKPSVQLVLLHVFVICFFHFRFSCTCKPIYWLDCTCSSVWLLML